MGFGSGEGAAAGAAVGSIIPGIGTVVGGVVGSLVDPVSHLLASTFTELDAKHGFIPIMRQIALGLQNWGLKATLPTKGGDRNTAIYATVYSRYVKDQGQDPGGLPSRAFGDYAIVEWNAWAAPESAKGTPSQLEPWFLAHAEQGTVFDLSPFHMANFKLTDLPNAGQHLGPATMQEIAGPAAGVGAAAQSAVQAVGQTARAAASAVGKINPALLVAGGAGILLLLGLLIFSRR